LVHLLLLLELVLRQMPPVLLALLVHLLQKL
jgi:hypothetical protein